MSTSRSSHVSRRCRGRPCQRCAGRAGVQSSRGTAAASCAGSRTWSAGSRSTCDDARSVPAGTTHTSTAERSSLRRRSRAGAPHADPPHHLADMAPTGDRAAVLQARAALRLPLGRGGRVAGIASSGRGSWWSSAMSFTAELARAALPPERHHGRGGVVPVQRGKFAVTATTWTMRLARMLGDELAAAGRTQTREPVARDIDDLGDVAAIAALPPKPRRDPEGAETDPVRGYLIRYLTVRNKFDKETRRPGQQHAATW